MNAKLVCLYGTNGRVILENKDSDWRNIRKERSEKNMSNFDYNCGGYALETYNWILPMFHEEDTVSWDFDFVEDEDEMTKYANEALDAVVEMANYLGEDVDETICNSYERDSFATAVAIRIAVENMLSAFSDMREIKDFSELKDDEYGIVYAGGFCDFHYVKFKDGIYTHKMGSGIIKTVDNYEDAFGTKYTSERVLLAKKKLGLALL